MGFTELPQDPSFAPIYHGTKRICGSCELTSINSNERNIIILLLREPKPDRLL
uniref:Uncharacterized protein n=1 Tax=Arundo donax TaxID=35708 RepID=A0A0A9H601_ARUDO